MLKRLSPYIAIVFLVLIDISVVPVFSQGEYMLPLTLIFVMCFALLAGRIHGMLGGLAGGLLIDILTGYPLGYMSVTYVVCGYLCGALGYASDELRASEKFSRKLAFVRRAAIAFISLALFEGVTVIYQYFNTAYFVMAFVHRGALRVLIGCAAVSIAYYPLYPLIVGRAKRRVVLESKKEVKRL